MQSLGYPFRIALQKDSSFFRSTYNQSVELGNPLGGLTISTYTDFLEKKLAMICHLSAYLEDGGMNLSMLKGGLGDLTKILLSPAPDPFNLLSFKDKIFKPSFKILFDFLSTDNFQGVY
jgi:hypothetical protein